MKALKSAAPKKGRKRSAVGGERLSDIQEEEEHVEGAGLRRLPSSYVFEAPKKSRDLKVGDVLKLNKGQRVPADVVILKCVAQESARGTAAADAPAEPEPLLVDTTGEGSGEGSSQNDTKPSEETPKGNGAGPGGETFIRTDQLDGETDWKLRLASPLSQSLTTEELVRLRVTGAKPDKRGQRVCGHNGAAAVQTRRHEQQR